MQVRAANIVSTVHVFVMKNPFQQDHFGTVFVLLKDQVFLAEMPLVLLIPFQVFMSSKTIQKP